MKFCLLIAIFVLALSGIYSYKKLDELAIRGYNPELIIDVGANAGKWTISTQKTWPKATFLMIEGNQNLKPTLEAIGQEVEIGVVTSTVGQELTFYTSKKDTGKTGSSIFREDTHAFKDKFLELEVKVKTKTLDDILARRNLTGKITFLKLDIQGAEIEALKGATILLRNVDFILSEVSLFQYNVGAPSFAKTVYFMNKIGYVMYDINDMLYMKYGHLGKYLLQMDVIWVRKTSYFYSKNATAFEPILIENFED